MTNKISSFIRWCGDEKELWRVALEHDPHSFPLRHQETLPEGWAAHTIRAVYPDFSIEYRCSPEDQWSRKVIQDPEFRRCYRMYHTESKQYYYYDYFRAIVYKCCMLVVAIPLYTAVYMAWNTLRIVTTTGYVLCSGLAKTAALRTNILGNLRETGQASLKALVDAVKTALRAPFYACKMWVGALVGIFSPLKGRIIIAEAESALHFPHTRQDEIRKKAFNWGDVAVDALFGNQYTYYLAFCMQPTFTVEQYRDRCFLGWNQRWVEKEVTIHDQEEECLDQGKTIQWESRKGPESLNPGIITIEVTDLQRGLQFCRAI